MDVEIARPVAEVFAAWTTAEAFSSWFAPMAASKPIVSMDFAVDGEYSIEVPMGDGAVYVTKGVFKEIVPERKIVMTWHCSAFPDPETLVTVHFDEESSVTTVRLTHERFETETTCDNHRGGWDACLAELQRFLVAGQAAAGRDSSFRD